MTETQYKKLEEENQKLKIEVEELKVKLQKYTNNDASKRYYQKNRDKIIEKSKERVEKLRETNPEIQNKYSRDYYHRKKQQT
jgi:regulator of replication initiation timing